MKKEYVYIISGIALIGLGSAWYFIFRGKGKSKYEKV
jgi:hypothetical protein